jgi:hypothetical protein
MVKQFVDKLFLSSALWTVMSLIVIRMTPDTASFQVKLLEVVSTLTRMAVAILCVFATIWVNMSFLT